MIDGNSISVDETAPAGQLTERQDFSNVQGFQVAGSGVPANGAADQSDAAWREALRLELEARAARFHQAVDASIILANDGIIRWLGDPIAKLTPGPDLLTPRAVILADDLLSEEAREIVAARLDLWLGAVTRRLLGPLFALQALQEESEAVRDLAGKIARSLGILDRNPIRNQIRALDQNARAALRKHSVRFGAYYIYVSTVLKPAARVLALQLWGLQTPGETAEALAQTLAALASSGRTSLPHDHLISREGYRVAGFRPCDDRIVRVDIIERLADMIRAAFVERSVKGESRQSVQGASRGFVVNGQMTSLTGCSGEHFASILRSLGFECVEMKRSEFLGDSPEIESKRTGADSVSIDASEHSRPPKDDGSPAAHEHAIDTPTDPALAGLEGAQVAGAGMEAASEEAPVAESHSWKTEGEHRAEMAFPPTGTAPSTSSSKKWAILADTIAVWRPAQKTRPAARKWRRFRQSRNGSPARELPTASPHDHGRGRDASDSSLSEREPTKRRAENSASTGAAGTGAGAADSSPVAERSSDTPAHENRRQKASKRDIRNKRSDSGLQQTATVDPNSPFAKLIELRSLLEAQSKNHP